MTDQWNRPPQNNLKLESENAIQALGLKTGRELTLVKRVLAQQSALGVGTTLKGKLKNDVHLNLPVEFTNGVNTSNLKGIKLENGRYFIETLTSVYEVSEKLSDFESFSTEKGSVYTVLDTGQVQRFKTALLDQSYEGEDKGEQAEREPSDIMLFYKPRTGAASWFDGVSANDHKTDKKVAQSIEIGCYKSDDNGNYEVIKNNDDLNSPFIFVRTRKDDEFRLKDKLTLEELKQFESRILKPENKGLGTIIPSENYNISNVPVVGYYTFDYKYRADGKVESMHAGNKVVSVKRKGV